MWTVFGGLLASCLNTGSVTFDIVSDYLNAQEFLGNNTNQTTGNATLSSDPGEIHEIWGTVAMALIFLPGAVLFLPLTLELYQTFFIRRLTFFNIKSTLLKYCCWCLSPVAMALLPFCTILYHFMHTLLHFIALIFDIGISIFGGHSQAMEGKNGLSPWIQLCKNVVENLHGKEAFYESFPQLVLQGYTLLYGYKSTPIQMTSITFSLFMLSKTAVQNDIFMSGKNMNFTESLSHSARTLPCYLTTIVFRVSTFCLTIACLRRWAWIPMICLLLELVVVSYVRYQSQKKLITMLTSIYHSSFSNCGVLNGYPTKSIFFEQKEDGGYCEKSEANPEQPDRKDDEITSDAQTQTETNGDERLEVKQERLEAKQFIQRSAIVSFVHHSIVMGSILIMAHFYPDYWARSEFDNLILRPGSERFFWVMGFTLMMGVYSTVLQLQVAGTMVEMEGKKFSLLEENK